MAGRAMFADGARGEAEWLKEQREIEAERAERRGDDALARAIRARPLPGAVDDSSEPYGARQVAR